MLFYLRMRYLLLHFREWQPTPCQPKSTRRDARTRQTTGALTFEYLRSDAANGEPSQLIGSLLQRSTPALAGAQMSGRTSRTPGSKRELDLYYTPKRPEYIKRARRFIDFSRFGFILWVDAAFCRLPKCAPCAPSGWRDRAALDNLGKARLWQVRKTVRH